MLCSTQEVQSYMEQCALIEGTCGNEMSAFAFDFVDYRLDEIHEFLKFLCV